MGDADHALARSEPPGSLLRALVDQVSDLIAITDAIGTVAWANVAFIEATGFMAGSLAHTLLAFTPLGPAGTQARLALGGMLATPPSEAGGLRMKGKDGTEFWVDARVQLLDSQLLWTFRDMTAVHRLSLQSRRQGELLEATQEFGRLGTWEREIPSGQGHWDVHVFGFWGIDPKDGTPSHEAAIERIHPEDRVRMNYIESTRRAGRYAQRYRVMRGDGSVRWIHSQWEVRNGVHGVPDRALGVMVDDTESYEAARALLGANAQLQMAVELGRVSIWSHDLRSDLMFCSDKGFELLGMPSRPEGHSLDEVRSYIHPDDLPAVVESVEKALESGQPTDTETRYRRADGTWRYVLTRRVVERDEAGRPRGFLGVALDMTERIEHLRHAEELARRLDAASRAAGIGIWSASVAPLQTDWNAQMFVIFDHFQPPHVPTFDRWITEAVHPDDRERTRSASREYLANGDGLFEAEFRIHRRDGSVRWIVLRADIDHGVTGHRRVVGVAMDVTERHESIDALREASRRAAFITRHAGIGMWETTMTGDNMRWDERMFELRGMSSADGVPPHEERLAVVHPDDLPVLLDSLSGASQSDVATSYEFRVCLPDGRYRWLASRSAVVVDETGRATRRVGVNWDITESKNSDLARQQAVLAEREIQAKSQFLSRMSHELRTPLNAVLGFTQILQIEARQSGSEGQLAKLEHIRSAGDHLLSLINDVLDLSGLESGELRLTLRAVDVGELVQRSLPLVQSLAEQHGVELEVRAEGGVARADPTRLRQVLINLLSNAIKYNRRGGRVVVESALAGGQVRLVVRDTGRGLSPEQIANLFEPFNRFGVEHEGIEGTGIGLTIVKALVDGMGGTIHVSSEPGAGTTFDVRLPAADAVKPRHDATPQVVASLAEAPRGVPGRANERRGRILYIEDNQVNVLLVEELVKSIRGLDIVSEPTGTAGVAVAIRLVPDLVLIDLQLPDFDGYEVLRRLRAEPATRAIRCVALSANAMPEDISRGLAAGFSDYLTKPIDFALFIGAIHTYFPETTAAAEAAAGSDDAVRRAGAPEALN
ncbi:MAG: PAS domain-containing protein [Caldimonas sp.]